MRRGARARVWWCVARRTQARSSRAWRMVTSARVGVGVPLRARTGWRVSGGDLRTAPTAQGSQAASSRSGRGQQCGLIVMEHSPSRGGGTSREEWCASHASRSSRTTSSINGEHHPCYDGSRGVLPCEETTPSCCPSKALGAQTPGISSSRCVGAYPHRSRSASSRLRRLPPGGNIQQAGAVFPYCGEGRPHGQRRDRPPHVALERRIEAPGPPPATPAAAPPGQPRRGPRQRPGARSPAPAAATVPPPGVSSGRPGGRCAGSQGWQGRCRRARSS